MSDCGMKVNVRIKKIDILSAVPSFLAHLFCCFSVIILCAYVLSPINPEHDILTLHYDNM